MSNSVIDRMFPPKYFNDSPVTDILKAKEKSIILLSKSSSDENTKIYNNFNEMFKTYLDKLPNNNVKKYVLDVFNRDLIFIGATSSHKNDAVFTRIFIKDKLAGIVLDSKVLDINLFSGDSPNIDDCVYAVYFGLCRAATLMNQRDIRNNLDLHKVITAYIYILLVKALGQNTVYNDKYKTAFHIACIYSYYRHFFKEKHTKTISIIKRDYKDIVPEDMLKEFLPSMDNVSRYDNLKDLPKILIDLNVYNGTPQNVILSFLKLLGNNGFYNLIGSLDQLIGMIVVSKYPTDLFNKNVSVTDKIHDTVEKIIVKHINRIQYSNTALLK